MSDLEKARAYFQKDRFATENGAVIAEVAENYAVCTLSLTDHHRNAMGNVMGGVLFMLGDFAFAVASNCGGTPMVSLNSQITYLSPAKGDVLIAEARRVRQGRSTGYYRVTIADELGTLVAEVVATGFVVKK